MPSPWPTGSSRDSSFSASSRKSRPRRCPTVIAFLFPGQGSQKVGHGSGARRRVSHLPRHVCRSRRSAGHASQPSLLRRPRRPADADREPATCHSCRQRRRASSRCVEGHDRIVCRRPQPGEYSANVAAGTLSFADAVRAVKNRGRYMQEAVPVGPARWPRSLDSMRPLSHRRAPKRSDGDVVTPANLNGAGQVVIAGSKDAVARAGERAKALGARRWCRCR